MNSFGGYGNQYNVMGVPDPIHHPQQNQQSSLTSCQQILDLLGRLQRYRGWHLLTLWILCFGHVRRWRVPYLVLIYPLRLLIMIGRDWVLCLTLGPHGHSTHRSNGWGNQKAMKRDLGKHSPQMNGDWGWWNKQERAILSLSSDNSLTQGDSWPLWACQILGFRRKCSTYPKWCRIPGFQRKCST